MDASWEERLAKTFVQLADTLVSEFDLPRFLRLLARRSRELLEVSAVELLVAGPRGEVHLVTEVGPDAGRLEPSRHLDDGPGAECLRTGRPVSGTDLESTARRWPRFAEDAVAAGYRSVHALPMRLRDDVIGAVTLLRDVPGPLAAARLRVGQSLVDVATIGILQHRTIHHNRRLAGQLHTALTSRVPIEQAKGVLSERLGVGVDEAFAVLRGHARHHNRRLTEMAREVVDGRDQLAGGPGPTSPVGAVAGTVAGTVSGVAGTVGGGVPPAARGASTGER